MTDQNTVTAVRHVPERNRYEIQVDGTTAGFTAYRDRGQQRVFHHTRIFEEFSGQGLASRLVRGALDDVRDTGRRVVPVCPYVKKFLAGHDEFDDVTDPVTPDVLEWLDAALKHG
ncbi:N-acetyltransferase [Streptomyces spinoverrucosus]|uniref:N-acetyltransferase n=1 Tax=Streptomyces spinoverrucosus TaxID=284043 RepID=A0A4Y3VYJ9_9ACTN|nr:GNAT family N-acetyltransferase [Streptomyces spinoverrucosus]GEC10730.1 N-acetyltransferase [Streptomyces spinoverrucosus]GHB99125.1 N-acetyltransferase [Streptomyces spinoverrucosus]